MAEINIILFVILYYMIKTILVSAMIGFCIHFVYSAIVKLVKGFQCPDCKKNHAMVYDGKQAYDQKDGYQVVNVGGSMSTPEGEQFNIQMPQQRKIRTVWYIKYYHCKYCDQKYEAKDSENYANYYLDA